MAKDDEDLHKPFSERMEAHGQLPGICLSLGLTISLELRAIL